jgi:thioredoxin 1
MKIIKYLLVACLFVSSVSPLKAEKYPWAGNKKQGEKQEGIQFFEGTFKQALAKAQKENKMVFIDSYTRWCGPCKTMKNVILKEERLAAYLNENFVCMSVNIERGEGPSIKRRYPHGTFPSLLYIKPNGKLKNKFLGMPDHGATELLNFSKMSFQSQ